MIEVLLAALVAIVGGTLLGAVLAEPERVWRDLVRGLEDGTALVLAGARVVRRELADVARRWTA